MQCGLMSGGWQEAVQQCSSPIPHTMSSSSGEVTRMVWTAEVWAAASSAVFLSWPYRTNSRMNFNTDPLVIGGLLSAGQL